MWEEGRPASSNVLSLPSKWKDWVDPSIVLESSQLIFHALEGSNTKELVLIVHNLDLECFDDEIFLQNKFVRFAGEFHSRSVGIHLNDACISFV